MTRQVPASVNDPYDAFFQRAEEEFGNLRHSSTSRGIEVTIPRGLTSGTVVADLLVTIPERWWTDPSRALRSSNWKWREHISESKSEGEVGLEREIIATCMLAHWTYQMPTMSGLADSTRHRRRSIDLVHKVSLDHFEFIELKLGSDNPTYAAIEILGYALSYCRARQQGFQPITNGNRLPNVMTARRIDLIVLAPFIWFGYQTRGGNAEIFELDRLTQVLNEQLADLPETLGLSGLDHLTFEFRGFDRASIAGELHKGMPTGHSWSRGFAPAPA